MQQEKLIKLLSIATRNSDDSILLLSRTRLVCLTRN